MTTDLKDTQPGQEVTTEISERLFLLTPERPDESGVASRLALMHYARVKEAMDDEDDARQIREFLANIYEGMAGEVMLDEEDLDVEVCE